MPLPQTEILWVISLFTAIVIILFGFFIAVIMVNQRKFINIQNEKLAESKRLEEVLRRIPRQMIEVQEEERARVARDLHDGINQMLASINYRAHALRKQPSRRDPQLDESVQHLLNDLEKTMDEVKRISHDLRPQALDDLGFEAAVKTMCLEFAQRTKIGIKCKFGGLPENMLKETELGIFRIIQEALNNIEKHAKASSVVLESETHDAMFSIAITDNGHGFVEHNAGLTAGRRRGLGLNTMRERALSIGGVLDIRATPNRGTTVTVRIPMHPPSP